MKALLFSISLLFAELLFAASPAEFAAAINVSGRQRMLSQKMAKEALQNHLKVKTKDKLPDIKETMTLFESSLNALIKGDKSKSIPAPPDAKIKGQLEKVQKLWVDYKAALNQSNLPEIEKQSPVVLREMNKAVKLYEVASVKAGVKSKGKVINIAGRQRMLSQKLAKEVFLVAADINKKKNFKAIEKTKGLFSSSLSALMDGDKKMRIEATQDSSIKTQLELVKKLWGEYLVQVDKVIKTQKVSPEAAQAIADINPQVLVEMNKAVGMFEKSTAQAH